MPFHETHAPSPGGDVATELRNSPLANQRPAWRRLLPCRPFAPVGRCRLFHCNIGALDDVGPFEALVGNQLAERLRAAWYWRHIHFIEPGAQLRIF